MAGLLLGREKIFLPLPRVAHQLLPAQKRKASWEGGPGVGAPPSGLPASVLLEVALINFHTVLVGLSWVAVRVRLA